MSTVSPPCHLSVVPGLPEQYFDLVRKLCRDCAPAERCSGESSGVPSPSLSECSPQLAVQAHEPTVGQNQGRERHVDGTGHKLPMSGLVVEPNARGSDEQLQWQVDPKIVPFVVCHFLQDLRTPGRPIDRAPCQVDFAILVQYFRGSPQTSDPAATFCVAGSAC